MGSINDYGRRRPQFRTGEGHGKILAKRLLRQCVAAALFLFLVGAGVGADNLLGDGARYVVAGVSSESEGWSWDQDTTEVLAEESLVPPEEAEEDTMPIFTAPASGVVVTDLAVAASGFPTEEGILIQGSAGQNVKAAADGSVTYVGESEDGYLIQVQHSGGFCSVYQGLTELSVSSGDEVLLGQVLGTTESGELTFSLLKDEVEVDPLEYLFQETTL